VTIGADEVSAYVWFPQEQLLQVLNRDHAHSADKVIVNGEEGKKWAVDLETFFPYYPNAKRTGIGKGSAYALRYLLWMQAQISSDE
jgi:hypothetical protein